MKYIYLTQGMVATVDDDNEYLNKYSWCAYKHRNTYYAAGWINSAVRRIRMHTMIIGKAPPGYGIDHIDGDGLNNMRSNLRIVTYRQNRLNHCGDKTSNYPGVSYCKNRNLYAAQLRIAGKQTSLGRYRTEEEAFQVYKDKLESLGECLI